MQSHWQSRLARPIVLRDGTRLETLLDAGTFITGLPEAFHHRNAWIRAVELLTEAAERDGSIEAATDQIERAFFLQGIWMPRT